MYRILHLLSGVLADVIDQAACATTDKSFQRIADAGNAAVVELHEAIGEGNQHEEVKKLRHVEARSTLRGSKGLLHPKPDQRDGRKRKHHVDSQRINRWGNGSGKVVAPVLYEDEEVHCRFPRSIVKGPLCTCRGLLWSHGAKGLLVAVSSLEERL